MEYESSQSQRRLEEIKASVRNVRSGIEAEYARTTNSWMECAGSRAFQLECFLDSEKAEQELGKDVCESLRTKLARAIDRLIELKRQYPDKQTEPPAEIKEEMISLLTVV